MLPDSRMLLTLWLFVNHLIVCEARSDLKLGRARLRHCSSRQVELCFISRSKSCGILEVYILTYSNVQPKPVSGQL